MRIKFQKGSITLSLQVIIHEAIFYLIFSDCALDETCVLCEKCFNYEAHKDHNFWYTIGTNNSGSCDCGEDDSWKNDLQCQHHGQEIKVLSNDHIIGIDPESTLVRLIEPILVYILESLMKYYKTRNEPKINECIVTLYNDENHSFDDVIDILSADIEISKELSLDYANLVDSKVIMILRFSPDSFFLF